MMLSAAALKLSAWQVIRTQLEILHTLMVNHERSMFTVPMV